MVVQEVESPRGRQFVTIGMIIVNLNKVKFAKQDKLDEMLRLAVNLIQNRSNREIFQTERLADKLKSDIERTLDGIFAHRFLLFYSKSFFPSNHTTISEYFHY